MLFRSQCLADNKFIFNNLASISSGSIAYNWNFGNATSSSNTNPTYSYNNPGTYTVTLTATSNYGCADSAKRTIEVKNIIKPAFTVNNNKQCSKNNAFSFTNTTSQQPENTSYQWIFGDGNSSNDSNPTY